MKCFPLAEQPQIIPTVSGFKSLLTAYPSIIGKALPARHLRKGNGDVGGLSGKQVVRDRSKPISKPINDPRCHSQDTLALCD